MRPRVGMVTCQAVPGLHADEAAVLVGLEAMDVAAQPVVWNDPAVVWSDFDQLVLRSTWDYVEHVQEFRAWLDLVERAGVPIENSPALVRWNLDKRYLAELAALGVAIVPTRFLTAGQDLSACLREEGWSEAILKPTLSAGARRTFRFASANAPQAELDAILRESGAMLQPFLPEILSEGEWSLIFFDGELSHCVVKTPAPGDFRIQPQFGGRFVRTEPTAAILRAAMEILDRLPVRPFYARVDGIRRGDQFLLMEVEVIEPFLFLPAAPGALERYVRAIGRLVTRA